METLPQPRNKINYAVLICMSVLLFGCSVDTKAQISEFKIPTRQERIIYMTNDKFAKRYNQLLLQSLRPKFHEAALKILVGILSEEEEQRLYFKALDLDDSTTNNCFTQISEGKAAIYSIYQSTDTPTFDFNNIPKQLAPDFIIGKPSLVVDKYNPKRAYIYIDDLKFESMSYD